MKRFVAILLIVLIVVLLVSCGISERLTAAKVAPVSSAADLQKQIDKLTHRVEILEENLNDPYGFDPYSFRHDTRD